MLMSIPAPEWFQHRGRPQGGGQASVQPLPIAVSYLGAATAAALLIRDRS